jgi:hypothetical protein
MYEKRELGQQSRLAHGSSKRPDGHGSGPLVAWLPCGGAARFPGTPGGRQSAQSTPRSSAQGGMAMGRLQRRWHTAGLQGTEGQKHLSLEPDSERDFHLDRLTVVALA